MSKSMQYQVLTSKYHSNVTHLNHEIVLMERTQFYSEQKTQIDAFGDIWVMAFADIPADSLKLRNGSDYLTIQGPIGVFVGQFSLVEWKILAPQITWKAISSIHPLSAFWTEKTFLFPWDYNIPKNLQECHQLLSNLSKTEIKIHRKSSSVADKTKKYIDSHFDKNLKINEIATKFNYSWAVMSREFQKTYGLSPIAYRHRLRVFKAMKLLSTGCDVTFALSESGFDSSSQFYIHFKKNLATNPQNYCIKKLIKSIT
ncbi:MAG: helix-turn-helix transcriptional regulator [Bdellovibrionaceae bacterium]|nr:helix-turn-helix transcriptional regulator [Pseudobdellovibrionaceae bacterium]